jgi:hypothetical protein
MDNFIKLCYEVVTHQEKLKRNSISVYGAYYIPEISAGVVYNQYTSFVGEVNIKSRI